MTAPVRPERPQPAARRPRGPLARPRRPRRPAPAPAARLTTSHAHPAQAPSTGAPPHAPAPHTTAVNMS
ncbi:hypothetical protein ACWGBV_36060, partial [Streptomyces sp. NPDC055051]